MIQIKQYSPSNHKIKAVIYGASGSGKTYFGGTAEKAIFASAESGLLSISDKRPEYVEIRSLQDLRDLYAYLAKGEHSYETVIIDSITEINEIIKSDLERTKGKGDMNQYLWGQLGKEIKTTLRAFRDLPLHVLLIAQEIVDKDDNNAIIKRVPSLNGKAATEIAYYMDIVGYIYVAGGQHKITTAPNEKLLTKDRSGLIGADAPVNFQEWIERISSMKVEKQSTEPVQVTTIPNEKNTTSSSKYFDTVIKRIDGLSTKEELTEALEKIASMDRLTEEQQITVKGTIEARLISLEKFPTSVV